MSANDSDFLDITDEENQDSHNSSNVSHRQLVLRNPGFKTPGRISSLPGIPSIKFNKNPNSLKNVLPPARWLRLLQYVDLKDSSR